MNYALFQRGANLSPEHLEERGSDDVPKSENGETAG
jgi:hypothetical protein